MLINQIFSLPLLLALICTFIPSTHSQKLSSCQLQGFPGQNAAPTTICSVDVTFTRVSPCAADVIERYTFPYVSLSELHRDVPQVSFQSVNNIRTMYNGTVIQPRVSELWTGSTRIEIVVKQSTEPVDFEVSYRLENSVMRFSNNCEIRDWNENHNVMRWSTGTWAEELESVDVQFQSLVPGTTLSAIDDKFEVERFSANSLRVSLKNIVDVAEVYVREVGMEVCSQDLMCVIDWEKGEQVQQYEGVTLNREGGLIIGGILIFWGFLLGCCFFGQRAKIRKEEVDNILVQDNSHSLEDGLETEEDSTGDSIY